MVQASPNRSALTGVVRGRGPDPERSGWDVVHVEVTSTAPAAGQADLLASHVGNEIDLVVPHDLLPGGDLVGWTIRCRAEMAGPGVIMAERDPAPGAFSIDPP